VHGQAFVADPSCKELILGLNSGFYWHKNAGLPDCSDFVQSWTPIDKLVNANQVRTCEWLRLHEPIALWKWLGNQKKQNEKWQIIAKKYGRSTITFM